MSYSFDEFTFPSASKPANISSDFARECLTAGTEDASGAVDFVATKDGIAVVGIGDLEDPLEACAALARTVAKHISPGCKAVITASDSPDEYEAAVDPPVGYAVQRPLFGNEHRFYKMCFKPRVILPDGSSVTEEEFLEQRGSGGPQ